MTYDDGKRPVSPRHVPFHQLASLLSVTVIMSPCNITHVRGGREEGERDSLGHARVYRSHITPRNKPNDTAPS